MPGRKAVGTNTAERQRDATTGAGYFPHGLKRRILGRQSFLDVTFDRFDDDNGVVHDQAHRRIRPKSESVLIENPNNGNKTKVPTKRPARPGGELASRASLARKTKTTRRPARARQSK